MRQWKMTDDERRALRELRALCKKLGVTMEKDASGETAEVRLTAPKNHNFGDIHEVVDSVYLPWHNDYRDLIDTLQTCPPEPCTDPECEWCQST